MSRDFASNICLWINRRLLDTAWLIRSMFEMSE